MSDKPRLYDGFIPGVMPWTPTTAMAGSVRGHVASRLNLAHFRDQNWEPKNTALLNEDDFALILAEVTRYQFLLVGTGPDLVPLQDAVRSRLKQAGIRSIEVLATGAAARTYNILVAEDRKVAAALIAVE